ncbi:hypothetical protein BJX62DRAFT_241178 [Aspergillus germanicus]
MSPSEVAKALLWIDTVVSAVEKFVIYDDELAATLAGIETLVLLSKYYINQGHLRKAWRTARRAIEFAQLTGAHKSPLHAQPLFSRRL